MFRIALTSLIIGCFAFITNAQTVQNEVKPVGKSIITNGTQLFYSLPKNAVEITLNIKVIEHYKGPYANYSQKYLNITDGIILRDAMFYNIENSELNRLSYPDSSQIFSIITNNSFPPFLQLNADGVILGCNVRSELTGYNIDKPQLIEPEFEDAGFAFTDLGVKPFMKQKPITLYKTIPTDSTPRKVAYIKEQMVETTAEENAEEAADFIRKIRKRRLKLIAALDGEVVETNSSNLELMITELNDLEAEYIALFKGKTFEYNQKVKLIFEPSDKQENEQKIIAWFSPTEGITLKKPSSKRNDYEPVLLNSVPAYQLPETQIQQTDNTQKSPTSIKYGLYQRIPASINLTLQLIDKKLAVKQMQISQKGKTIPLPASYINSNKYGIEFYPETGMMKRIHYYKD